jgi:hypothetical protein
MIRFRDISDRARLPWRFFGRVGRQPAGGLRAGF